MKNGKGNVWFSYSAYKKDMLALFEESTRDIRKDIKEIKKTLANHLTDDHKQLNNTLNRHTKQLDKLEEGQKELKHLILKKS